MRDALAGSFEALSFSVGLCELQMYLTVKHGCLWIKFSFVYYGQTFEP
jgi:hypothetical protein